MQRRGGPNKGGYGGKPQRRDDARSGSPERGRQGKSKARHGNPQDESAARDGGRGQERRFGNKPHGKPHYDQAQRRDETRSAGLERNPDKDPSRPGKPQRKSQDGSGGHDSMRGQQRRFGNKPQGKPHYDTPRRHAQKPVTPQPVATPRAESAAQEKRAPHRFGQLLHGLHAVREAWLNPARQCRQLWLTAAMEAEFAPTLAEAAERKLSRPAPQRAERTLLDELLPGAVHQGIALDAAPLPELTLDGLLARAPQLLVMLDQVTDPHNVGAILRSAAAFGAQGVIITERHAPGLTGTLAKTASGALEHVPLVPVVNLARALDQLREAGFWCIGLAEEGEKPLGAHDLSGKTALVLGAEGDGLRRLTRERCDALAKLPTQGPIGSLNVSNAAAVALYEANRQQKR